MRRLYQWPDTLTPDLASNADRYALTPGHGERNRYAVTLPITFFPYENVFNFTLFHYENVYI
jgi:hypothetical protein